MTSERGDLTHTALQANGGLFNKWYSQHCACFLREATGSELIFAPSRYDTTPVRLSGHRHSRKVDTKGTLLLDDAV